MLAKFHDRSFEFNFSPLSLMIDHFECALDHLMQVEELLFDAETILLNLCEIEQVVHEVEHHFRLKLESTDSVTDNLG